MAVCFPVKLKVKLSLCFYNWAPRHEGLLGEWKYSSTHSLTSALDGSEWSASRPGSFTPWERAFGTLWIGDWLGPRAVLEAVVKRKSPSIYVIYSDEHRHGLHLSRLIWKGLKQQNYIISLTIKGTYSWRCLWVFIQYRNTTRTLCIRHE
jgi:hypothetical protein